MIDFNIEDQVNSVRASALARQAKDDAERELQIDYDGGTTSIDTTSNIRGCGSEYSASLNDIATAIGAGHQKYPMPYVNKIFKTGVQRFCKHLFILTVNNVAVKLGHDEEDAFNIARITWERELSKGKDPVDILKEVVCLPDLPDAYEDEYKTVGGV